MQKKRGMQVFFCIFCTILLCLIVGANEAYDGYIVKLAPTFEALSSDGGGDAFCVVADRETAEQMVEDGLALYAEPNYIMEVLSAPSDPYYAEQWTLAAIGYPALYAAGYDGSGVTVAVLDSGLDISHPDLAGIRISPYSKNCLGDGTHTDAYYRDQLGHGSFVISQIAAVTDNGKGLAAVASGAEIMMLRVLAAKTSQRFMQDAAYDSGSGTVSTVSNAIRYAADNGADVINISLGIKSESTALKEAVAHAVGKGVIVVASAGNLGSSIPYYPAGCAGVIGVGSVSRTADGYVRSYFSQYNDTIDVVAPGGSVYGVQIYPSETGVWYTDAEDTYRTDSGTSYASPVVAGLAAIARQIDPTLDGEGFLSLLASTATDLGEAGKDVSFGYGLVDAAALLKAMQNEARMSPLAGGETFDRIADYAGDKSFALYDVLVEGYKPAAGARVSVAHTDGQAYVYRVVGAYLLHTEHTLTDGVCSFDGTAGIYAVSAEPLVLYGDATGDGRCSLVDAVRILKRTADDTIPIDCAAADLTGDAEITVADMLLLLKNLL